MSLSEKQLMLAYVAYQKEGDKALELFRFASPETEKLLTPEVIKWVQAGEAVTAEEVVKKMAGFRAKRRLSVLRDIHPGWILEKLKGESPRMLGALCRYLPSDKVAYLLANIDPEVRKSLPKMGQAFLIPEELSERLKEILESRFVVVQPEKQSRFSFQHLASVSSSDLYRLFWDLGQEECRKLFQGASSKVLTFLFSRLSADDARELKRRMKEGGVVDPETRKQAQMALIALPLETAAPEDFFTEIGFSVVARSVTRQELDWSEALVQKMPPRQGYLLKRMILEAFGDTSSGASDEKRKELQDQVISRFARLAQKAKVDHYWVNHPWRNSSDWEETRILKEDAA